jgi:hypothetical protein
VSIDVTYRRLKKANWSRLKKDPEKAAAFLFESWLEDGPESRNCVELQKDWHALHFLLTGDPSTDPEHLPDDPLHNVVMGGHETDIEASYGPVRCLEPKEVRAIAHELAKISVRLLRTRFSAKAFNDEEIYPNPEPGGWDRKEVESVFCVYPKLVRFFKAAAAAREVVLVYAAQLCQSCSREDCPGHHRTCASASSHAGLHAIESNNNVRFIL